MTTKNPPPVLLLTHRRDEFVPDRVYAALQHRGARPIRVDTDLFPGSAHFSLRRGPDGGLLKIGNDRIDLADVAAVWWRRIWPQKPEELEENVAMVCLLESEAMLEGLFTGLPGLRHVNHPAADRAAANKLMQLAAAQRLGLAIPPTLVSNDPAEIRSFVAEYPASITKLLTVNAVRGARAYTQRITATDLEDLEGLSLSPMFVQAEIPKQIELRVAVVGKQCFTAGIRAAVGTGPVDWRHPQAQGGDWEPWTLSGSIVSQLTMLVADLGLVYGGVDLIVQPDGRVVFLEVNSFGEWGMLEQSLGLPVADALAGALLEAV